MAITLTDIAERYLIKDVLGVDEVVFMRNPMDLSVGYSLIRNGKIVCHMIFDEYTPTEDRVTALRVAMRMSDGNDSQREGSSPS